MTPEQMEERIKNLESVIEDLIHVIRNYCEIDVTGADKLDELSVQLDQ